MNRPAFAEDIRRHLRDEPVEACPPSAVYSLRKFARRHRTAVATTSLVSVVLVAGIIASMLQAAPTTKAETLAEERLTAEREAHEEAEFFRAGAEANLSQALKAVDTLLDETANELLVNQPGLTEVRTRLLENAVTFCGAGQREPRK